MSYILDALKKSEQQRAATASVPVMLPDTAALADRRTWGGAGWLVFTVLLLAPVLLWFGFYAGHFPQPLTEREQAPVESSVDESPTSAVVAYVQEDAVSPAVTQETVLVVPAAPVLSAPGGEVSPAAEPLKPAAVQTRSLPPLASLRRIPALMINSHIYSPLPEKRSVTINNRPWREGEPLADGIILQEITPQGIVLDVDGWPLTVNRQQGWTPVPN